MNQATPGGPVRVPFIVGDSKHLNLAPNARSALPLAAGRWTLSPRATVPYANVAVAQWGEREYTWGQLIEIPEGSQGAVTNSSFHPGDAVFDAIGTGIGFNGRPPSAVTIPAQFTLNAQGTAFVSVNLDTRGARRAYLCCTTLTIGGGPLRITTFYQAMRRGRAFSDGTTAQAIGVQQFVLTTVGYKDMIPLGLGSGENREPAPGLSSLPETRPHALLDSLYVSIATGDAAAGGYTTSVDSFLLLEY